jgi:ABC-type lipoprotein export system ATPase subunit
VSAVELHDVFRVHSGADGEAAALQGLTLAVGDGEVVAVLGPSGSGKSTLLRIVGGLERQSAGSVRVLGAELAALRGRRLAAFRAGHVGYVDQHYAQALVPELTARELVALPLALAGEAERTRLARADGLLERVGLRDRAGARPAELSGGEQQRVALCAALARRPRLLLADEPTGELDRATAGTVYGLLGELSREHGCTTLLVSHDPTSTRIADRSILIRDGRVSEESAGGAGAIVVGRGGWLRVPEELLEAAGIGDRARARLEDGAVVLTPAGEPVRAAAEQVTDSDVLRPGAAVAEVRAAERSYPGVRGLAAVDATFAAGTVTAVTGPSGSGKSTLLRLLAGLDDPTAGSVAVLGTSPASLDRAERARFRRRHVAVVGQDPDLVPFLGARENVELALSIRGAGDASNREHALDLLAAIGLGDRVDHRADRLSAGERQRVAVAAALAARPELLLADEPTARLDGANAVAVAALLVRLARETGAAVVCATHDPLVIEQADAEVRLA